MSHWLTRILLLATLVLSQALYAGHGVIHANGDQVDCQVCLQASSGAAAVVCTEVGPSLAVYPAPLVSRDITAVSITPFPPTHPARAPPFFPV